MKTVKALIAEAGESRLRIFITGGSGFIGTNLVEHFLKKGHKVVNFDIKEPRNRLQKSTWVNGNILNSASIKEIVDDFRPDLIFHLAARTDLDGQSLGDYPQNTIGLENLIDAVKDLKSLQRIIFASSRLVCRIGYVPKDEFDYCPSTAYGESKVAGEKLVRDLSPNLPCPYIIVRPTSIWGPWFDVPYKTFFLTIASGTYFHPGNLLIFKSFGYVSNVVYSLEKLGSAPEEKISGITLDLADYPPLEISDFANTIQQQLGSKPIKRMNLLILRVLATCGDFFKLCGWKSPPLTTFRLNNLITPMVHNMDNLQDIVGDLPYSMKEGVKETVEWMGIGESEID